MLLPLLAKSVLQGVEEVVENPCGSHEARVLSLPLACVRKRLFFSSNPYPWQTSLRLPFTPTLSSPGYQLGAPPRQPRS